MSDDDAERWFEEAQNAQKRYYLAFAGRQWDEYDKADEDLLRVKICYSLFGPPTDRNADRMCDLEATYTAEQRQRADKIRAQIRRVHDKSGSRERLAVGIVFVDCKRGADEFRVPVFRVRTGPGNTTSCRFVDTQNRTYESWADWLEHNTLPPLVYCYPKHGFYSCSPWWCEHAFDEDDTPALDAGVSPAGRGRAVACRALDVAASVGAFAAAGVAIAAMFTPLGPLVVGASALSGGASAVWGTGRGARRLYDKKRHGEEMADLETAMLSLSILAAPLHVVAATTNAAIKAGARAGRIFSATTRTLVTILNTTTLTVDSAMLVVGIVNLVDKRRNGEDKPLDYVQFSISLFFFTHTLIQPKTASGIIKRAQRTHFREYQNGIDDADAKRAFDKFISDNNKDMRSGAKVCKTINRINDPEAFFRTAHQEGADITLGGKSGKTVFINGEVRINPNRFNQLPKETGKLLMDATKQYKEGLISKEDFNNKVADIKQRERIAFENHRKETYRKTADALGVKENELKDYKVNNKKIFENMKPDDIDRLGRVLGGPAKNYDPDMLKAALSISSDLKCENVHDFLAIVEIIATECAGKTEAQRKIFLANLCNDPKTKTEFLGNIQADTEKVKGTQHTYNSDLQAVNHHRKHGATTTVNCYLDETPKDVFQEKYLIKDVYSQDGSYRVQTYANPDGYIIGVQTLGPDGTRKTLTVFQNKKFFDHWNQRLPQYQEQLAHSRAQYDMTPPQLKTFMEEVLGQLTLHLGVASVEVDIFKGGDRFSLEEFLRNGQDDSDSIAKLKLMAETLAAVGA